MVEIAPTFYDKSGGLCDDRHYSCKAPDTLERLPAGELQFRYTGNHNFCESNSMKNITVSVDEETHRMARIRAAEVVLRPRDLDEVLPDFDARGVGVSERLTRDELYAEVIERTNAIH